MAAALAYTPKSMWEIRPDRIKSLMGDLGINQSQLADRVGVKQPSIGRILSGETKTSRHLRNIARELETSPEYLTGETDDPSPGSMFAGGQPSLQEQKPEPDPDTVVLSQIDMRYGLGGSYLDAPVVEAKRQFSRAWLREFTHTAPEHLFWALGDGDSMEPTIRSGELILIDRSHDTPRTSDGIWALAWGDIGMVKRLRPLPDGRVEIHSDNPLVPMSIAADGEVHLVGRVVAVMRRL